MGLPGEESRDETSVLKRRLFESRSLAEHSTGRLILVCRKRMGLHDPHPQFDRFFATLKRAPALFVPFGADVFRQTQPRWMSLPYRFTGIGSVMSGARWSVKGLIPTLYASLDPQTLSAEVYYKALRYGWKPSEFPGPQLVVRMHWDFKRVLNLTVPASLRQPGGRR